MNTKRIILGIDPGTQLLRFGIICVEGKKAALLEDNQKDGYIEIPECLRPYTGFDRID